MQAFLGISWLGQVNVFYHVLFVNKFPPEGVQKDNAERTIAAVVAATYCSSNYIKCLMPCHGHVYFCLFKWMLSGDLSIGVYMNGRVSKQRPGPTQVCMEEVRQPKRLVNITRWLFLLDLCRGPSEYTPRRGLRGVELALDIDARFINKHLMNYHSLEKQPPSGGIQL